MDFDTGQKWRYGTLRATNVPNLVTIAQMAAELLRFVEKFKMAASAILNLYLAILDHPRSYRDFKILKIWLKTPIQGPKIYVFGGF